MAAGRFHVAGAGREVVGLARVVVVGRLACLVGARASLHISWARECKLYRPSGYGWGIRFVWAWNMSFQDRRLGRRRARSAHS